MQQAIMMVRFLWEPDAQHALFLLLQQRYIQPMQVILERYYVEKDMLCLYLMIINRKMKWRERGFKQLEVI
jgi:hypothetical protein